MQPKLVVITGPTASGKTALGVALAQRLGGEVVSADSMQIYRGMDIGTAKPTPEEMQGVPHHMIDIADPTENYSVSRYAEEASACVDDILARAKLPIVKAKVGPRIMTLICDAAIFDQIPVKKEVKATVSGIYITGVRGIRGSLEQPEKKNGFWQKMLRKARGEEK